MQIDIASIVSSHANKITDMLELEIPLKTGERLSLTLDWALKPTVSTIMNKVQSRYGTPTPNAYFGPPQQA